MTNPLYSVEQLPATSAAAIREFSDRYLASVGAAPPRSWATDFGDLIPTESPLISFPVSSLALKYQQTEGESRFKELLEKSFDLKVQEFDTGIEGKLIDILSKVFAYRNWAQGPARLVLAEARFRNHQIATLLEDGENQKWGVGIENTSGIDGANFFSATHLSDFNDPDSTTWSNYQNSTKDVVSIANIQAEVVAMADVRDENGDKLGVVPDTILVPTEKSEPLKNLLAKELVLETTTSPGNIGVASTNPYLGRFTVVEVPEFTDVNDWYLVDSKLMKSIGLAPWISCRWTVPNPALELRTFGEESDFFKNTGKIKVSSHIHYGHALAFPHVIRKVKGA